MSFSRIPGHSEIIEKLVLSVREGRVSHAQLFTGPEGCGSLALAFAYARYIGCENRSETDSCGSCKSCLKHEKMIHPDMHYVFPVIKKKNSTDEPLSDDYLAAWREFNQKSPFGRVNDWLAFIGAGEHNAQGMIYTAESAEIIRKMSLKPYESDYKIMVIWQPERMNPTSANKLLKLLEEPPERTIFILVSDEPDRLLPTIISRCQIVKIPPFSTGEIKSYLRASFGATETEAENTARLARGNIARAEELSNADEALKQNLGYFRELMRYAWKRDVIELIKWAENITSEGREAQKNFLDYSLRLLRENFMLTLNQKMNELVFLSEEEADFSGKFHPFIKFENIQPLAGQFSLAISHIEANGYARLVFLDLALKVTKLIR